MTLNANRQLSSALKLQRWLDKASVEVNSAADEKIKNKFNQYFQELVELLDTVYDEENLFELPNKYKSQVDADFKSLIVEIPDDNEDVPVIDDDNYDAGVDPELSGDVPKHTPWTLDEMDDVSSDGHGIPPMSNVETVSVVSVDDDPEHDVSDRIPEQSSESEVKADEQQSDEPKGILDRISDVVEATAVNNFFASNPKDTDVEGGLNDIMTGALDATYIPTANDIIEKSSHDERDDDDNDDDEDNGAPMTIDNVENY